MYIETRSCNSASEQTIAGKEGEPAQRGASVGSVDLEGVHALICAAAGATLRRCPELGMQSHCRVLNNLAEQHLYQGWLKRIGPRQAGGGWSLDKASIQKLTFRAACLAGASQRAMDYLPAECGAHSMIIGHVHMPTTTNVWF